ncbi:MAG: OsmC family peroxiredoxin, partial [Pseudolabrys sp.]
MTNATSAIVNNGVNVDALMGARTALEQAPEAAQFKWRASCEWVNGTHSRSAIGGFFGLGTEQSRSKMFTVEADHPQLFAAEDNAPTPVELVLSGLASSLTAGVAAVAQRRGIQL